MRQKNVSPLMLLCLDSNCSFGKISAAAESADSALCLDSNCSFGKMESLPQELRFELCLDSNCSFGKIVVD